MKAERALVASLIVCLALSLLHAPGTSDVKQFVTWMGLLHALGPVRGYAAAGTPYPPLASVILLFASKVGHLITNDLQQADFLGLKWTLFCFWAGSAWLFLKLSNDGYLAAALALYFLLESVALGYLDVFYVSLLFLAIHYLMTALAIARVSGARVWSAGNPRTRSLLLFAIFFTTACWIKPQPVIGLPFVVLYFVKDIYGRRPSEWPLWKATPATRESLAEARVAIVVMALYSAALLAVFGAVPVLRSLYNVATHTSLSAYGLNLPWIAQHALHVALPQQFGPLAADGSSAIIYDTPPAILWFFKLLFAAHYGALMVWYIVRGRTPQDLLLMFALGFLSYVTLSPSVHENHLFAPIAILAMLTIYSPELKALACFWCLLGAIDLLLFYGIDGSRMELFSRSAGIDTALLLSIVAVAGFYWTIARSLRRSGRGPHDDGKRLSDLYLSA